MKTLLILALVLFNINSYAMTAYCSDTYGEKVCQYQDDQYRYRGTTYEYDQQSDDQSNNYGFPQDRTGQDGTDE